MPFATLTAAQRIQTYLDRIGYAGSTAPTAPNLAALQHAHLKAVPYENFDILRGKRLCYDTETLFDKIVTARRGGYCFELNGLFGWLLRQLGYPVTDWFARYLRDEPTLPARRHRVLRVEAGGEVWVADVGVGGVVPRFPLRLAEGVEQPQDAGASSTRRVRPAQGLECYRLVRDEMLGWVVQEWRHGAWSVYFSFTEEPQMEIDFSMPSFYCEYAPESPFNKEPIAAILAADGRKTLDGDTLKVFSPDGVAVTQVQGPAFDAALKEHFGIVLD